MRMPTRSFTRSFTRSSTHPSARSSTRTFVAIATVVAAAGIGGGGVAAAGGHHNATVIETEVLVGVDAPYTGAANPIRGINGGGRPWSIAAGSVELKADGKLEVEVAGLVLTSTGANPAPTFKATVSCLSKDAAGAASTVNVSTDPFPATAAGDAEFEGKVMLPSPCIAPIVFVANGANGAWFAATGV